MKKFKKESGITLIALIITVIILVILAAVSIRAVTSMKIVDYAINGAQNYVLAEKRERDIFKEVEDMFKPEDGIYIGGSKVLPPLYVYDKEEFLIMLSEPDFLYSGLMTDYCDMSITARDVECLDWPVKKGLMDEKVVDAFRTTISNSYAENDYGRGVYNAPEICIEKVRRINMEVIYPFLGRIWDSWRRI